MPCVLTFSRGGTLFQMILITVCRGVIIVDEPKCIFSNLLVIVDEPKCIFSNLLVLAWLQKCHITGQ